MMVRNIQIDSLIITGTAQFKGSRTGRTQLNIYLEFLHRQQRGVHQLVKMPQHIQLK